MNGKGSYGSKVAKLYKHEKAKPYPHRYPFNEDSIGIELVGAFDPKKKTYENPSEQQNKSLRWLVKALSDLLALDSDDIFKHPEVSYKQASEAQGAKW